MTSGSYCSLNMDAFNKKSLLIMVLCLFFNGIF